MLTFSDLAMVRIVRFVIFLLLLTIPSYTLASDSPVSNFTRFTSSRSFPVFEAQGRAERKLAAVPSGFGPAEGPDLAVSRIAPALNPPNPLPPSTPANRQPAVISPGTKTPGADLPPELLSPPPASVAPITSPTPSSKQSNAAVILGVTLGVLVFLVVSLSAVAYFRPEWLPCCRGRSNRLTQYERHMPT